MSSNKGLGAVNMMGKAHLPWCSAIKHHYNNFGSVEIRTLMGQALTLYFTMQPHFRPALKPPWMPKPAISPQGCALGDVGDDLDEQADPAGRLIPASSPWHPRYRQPPSSAPPNTNITLVARTLRFHRQTPKLEWKISRQSERIWAVHDIQGSRLLNALSLEVVYRP